MANLRDIYLDGYFDTVYFKCTKYDPPTPPPWYDGVPLFGYGTNPNLNEIYDNTPLSATFSSPFTEGNSHDSYLSRVAASGTAVRTRVGTRDWSDLKTLPPTDDLKPYLVARSPVGAKGFFKKDMGFCLYHSVCLEGFQSSGGEQLPHVLQLDVPSGGKTLTKQDFRLKVSAHGYSPNTGSNIAPCIGGFSLHEVYTPALTDALAYTKVAPRIVAMYMAHVPNASTPNITSATVQYNLTTDATRQMTPVADTDRQWINFLDSTKAYGTTATLKTTLYAPNVESRQLLFFVGTFSLKELHDYVTDTNKFANLVTTYQQDYEVGRFATIMFPTLSSQLGDVPPVKINLSQTRYKVGSFYSVIPKLKPKWYVSNGVPVGHQTPLMSPVGVYTMDYYGTGKIEAHTFNGSLKTPYKSVFLIERDTGRTLRTTTSDSDGRYVFHGVPTGIELVAMSVDMSKTLASVAEDFGVLE